MEEVPAHVHPGPIVPDVLSKHHEHRSGLIWSGDCETAVEIGDSHISPDMWGSVNNTAGCTGTVRFRDRRYKVKKEPLEAWILRVFAGSETDDDLILRSWIYFFIWLPYYDRALVPSNLWRAEVALICYEIVEYHYPERVMRQFARAQMVRDAYIRWYTRVYIGNPANRDTCSHGYQPAGVETDDGKFLCILTFMLQEVDDMASVAIREPPSSPSQMAAIMKKVQTIIRPCMVSIEGGGRPPIPSAPQRQEHLDPGPAVVEKGEGSGSGQPYVDPFDSPNLDMPSFSLGLTPTSQPHPSGSGILQIPPAPSLEFASFQSPHSSAYRFSGFRAPPPPSTAGSSTPHQLISQASSSDEEERQDDMDGVQALSFGHRAGKKTVLFTPSD
ncbi:hypothetical protein M9H77_28120 [Catharanthus roseus]|uniref:Uncharacterized protein n=1 Tax=Catharanthus roseus TaxID=4058 RepID=A0ACC0AH41_CATRO|nr:hypothetical protein M9H77_28120 [Catharanthus roseus]